MTLSERVARAYIAASNRCDYNAMADLFHPDAEWIPIAPMQPLRGQEAIRERYLTEVRPLNAPIINDQYIATDHRCAVEFDVDHPTQGITPIVDIFTTDTNGLITRLAAYRR